MAKTPAPKAPRNRTITLSPADEARLFAMSLDPSARPDPGLPLALEDIRRRTVRADFLTVAPSLPRGFIDLLFADPPYDIRKDFGDTRWKSLGRDAYLEWTRSWLDLAMPLLAPRASVYVCGDWRSSWALETALSERLTVRNRITWQREKGRSSASNWKQASEDIWFATASGEYSFDADAVKLKRRVRAPYRESGIAKDWAEDDEGKWRLTGASNLWDDCTVPFWSMPENTDHPAQKPEKLLARIILASSRPGDFVFDPFMGSGTACVVARKLGRDYCGVERESAYCALAERRLEHAKDDTGIQGYEDGVFLERNAKG